MLIRNALRYIFGGGGGGGGSSNAQLVLNDPAVTGFTFFIGFY